MKCCKVDVAFKISNNISFLLFFLISVARNSRSCVGKISGGIKSLARFLLWLISLVTYLNVLPYIWYFLCHLCGPRKLRKHSYAYNEYMVYSPTVSQWFGKLFRTGEREPICYCSCTYYKNFDYLILMLNWLYTYWYNSQKNYALILPYLYSTLNTRYVPNCHRCNISFHIG